MEIPNIIKSNRKREYALYDAIQVASVVYEYLFNGLSHRELDEKILHLDSSYSRGYQSMGILHYIGLRNDFKGFFVGLNVDQAIEKLEQKNNGDAYQELMGILSPLQYVGSTIHSWNIISPSIAIKTTDKSAFAYKGTGIPYSVTPFFNVESLAPSGRMDITLLYNDIEYKARVTRGSQSDSRVRLFWKSDLGRALQDVRNTLNELYPCMIFEYVQKNVYKISFGLQKDKVMKISEKSLIEMPLIKEVKPNRKIKRAKEREFSKNKVDYIEKAKKNKDLGHAGEKLVLRFEKDKLLRCGLVELSEKIIHVSEKIGDGEGYDILSYDDTQRPIYIEVKATKSNNQDQFFISSNEIDFAKAHKQEYFLYRVYDLNGEAKVTIYNYQDLTDLEFIPTQYFVKVADSED